MAHANDSKPSDQITPQSTALDNGGKPITQSASSASSSSGGIDDSHGPLMESTDEDVHPLIDAGVDPEVVKALRENEKDNPYEKEIESDAARLRRQSKVRTVTYIIWAVIGGCVLTGVGVYLLNILAIPVAIVLWTIVIIFCLRGIVNKLEERGLNRVLGTTIAYIIMVLVLAAVMLILFSPMFGVGDQFKNLVDSVPSYIKELTDWFNALYERYSSVLSNDEIQKYLNDAMNGLASWASSLAQSSATGVVAVGSGVANTFMSLGFGLVIAFYILVDLPQLGQEVRRLGGPRREETMTMLHLTFTRVMGGYIKATLVQCAIIGAGCAVLFGILQIPNFVAIAVITGILNIIPIIGPWLGGALAAIVGVFINPWSAIIALVGTIVIQQAVYTFVSPKIMSNSVDIHPAFTFLALMTGSAIGGAMNGLTGSLVGMLASIPFVAVAKSIFVYYFEKATGRRIVSDNGVFFKDKSTNDEPVNPIYDATGATSSPKVVTPVRVKQKGKAFEVKLIAKLDQKLDHENRESSAEKPASPDDKQPPKL